MSATVSIPIITFRQFRNHWKNAVSIFGVNVWNFEVAVAKNAVEVFQKSFDLKRFNTDGSKSWQRRVPTSKRRNPLLVDTGGMKRSIVWRHSGDGQLEVYTDPLFYHHSKNRRGIVYAGLHNTGEQYTYGRSSRRIPKRQFIGYSSEVAEFFNKNVSRLFSKLPY